MKFRQLFPFTVAVLLSACLSTPPQTAALQQQIAAALPTESAAELREPVLLAQVPFFSQSAYQCGPAALATVLVASHIAVTPEQLVPLVYVPERKGSFQVEMIAATRSHGRLAYRIDPTLTALFSEVRAGRPVLILQNLGLAWYPRWHFAVVTGFDLERGKVLMNSGIYEKYETSLPVFERTWARAEHWGMLALEPGILPATAEPGAYFIALAALEETQPKANIEVAYRSALQAWPTDRNLLMGYGNLLYQQGRHAEASQQFNSVITHYADYAPAWNNLAQIFFEQGDKQQALIHSRQAVSLGGDFIASYRATLRKVEASAF